MTDLRTMTWYGTPGTVGCPAAPISSASMLSQLSPSLLGVCRSHSALQSACSESESLDVSCLPCPLGGGEVNSKANLLKLSVFPTCLRTVFLSSHISVLELTT